MPAGSGAERPPPPSGNAALLDRWRRDASDPARSAAARGRRLQGRRQPDPRQLPVPRGQGLLHAPAHRFRRRPGVHRHGRAQRVSQEPRRVPAAAPVHAPGERAGHGRGQRSHHQRRAGAPHHPRLGARLREGTQLHRLRPPPQGQHDDHGEPRPRHHPARGDPREARNLPADERGHEVAVPVAAGDTIGWAGPHAAMD